VRLPVTWDASRGRVDDDHVVEIQDVMPTLLDAAGVTVPDTVDGRSMLPLARAENADWRPWLHGQHVRCYSHEQANHYLTDGRDKYIWFPHLGVEQLFDLRDDPGECNDLAADPKHADRLSRWRSRLVELLESRESGLVKDGQLVQQAP